MCSSTRATVRFPVVRVASIVLGLVMAAGYAMPACAQTEPAGTAVEKPSLDQCRWMVGHWKGADQEHGMEHEETWTTPSGGLMLGTFRMNVNDRPTVLEMLTLTVENGKLTFALRHFGPDLQAWEKEPIKLTAIKATETELVLENPSGDRPKRLTYRRKGQTMTALVESRRDGQTEKFELSFRRVEQTPAESK